MLRSSARVPTGSWTVPWDALSGGAHLAGPLETESLTVGGRRIHPPRLYSLCSLSPRGRAGQGCSQQSSSEKWAGGEGGGELCLRGSVYTVVEAWQAWMLLGQPAGSRPWESCVRRPSVGKISTSLKNLNLFLFHLSFGGLPMMMGLLYSVSTDLDVSFIEKVPLQKDLE